MTFDFDWVPQLAQGLVLTVEITAACVALGAALGLLLAVGRVYGRGPIRAVCTTYIHIFRGTPLLVQLAILYFGLPTWGITLSRFTCAVLALGLNSAAYQAEYFRGAIQSVDTGQLAAARALGMSRWRAVGSIVIPQALRLVLPSWSNELILMLKYSSVVFSISLYDLMGVGKRLASRHFRYFEVFLVVALFYLVVVFLISRPLRMLERRIRIPGLGNSAH